MLLQTPSIQRTVHTPDEQGRAHPASLNLRTLPKVSGSSLLSICGGSRTTNRTAFVVQASPTSPTSSKTAADVASGGSQLSFVATGANTDNVVSKNEEHQTVTTTQTEAQPVMVCRTHQLSAQGSNHVYSTTRQKAQLRLDAIQTDQLVSLESAAVALTQALQDVEHQYWAFTSGCVRIEVPLPAGTTAIHWLRAQTRQQQQQHKQEASLGARPCVYFSSRHSSAPDTPLAAQAEACTRTVAAAAGVGSAWCWQGASGGGFHSNTVRHMQRFLSPGQPHIRIYGGIRFDADSVPSPEWSSFGAYLFTLPLLEFSERDSACVVAVTVAWDKALPSQHGLQSSCDHHHHHHHQVPMWGSGSSSLRDAVNRAISAVQDMQPVVQSPSAGAQALHQQAGSSGPVHSPDKDTWTQQMSTLLTALGGGDAQQQQSGSEALGPRAAVDITMAKEAYLSRGQQGLDGLLEALNAAGGGQGASVGGQSPGEGGSVEGSLTKAVMARRSLHPVTGDLQPLWLLEALQERDPRSYQLYLGNGSTTSFLSCTPERLYSRTGRMVASEAVAGTRARGPPGDVESDFWLSMDLLNSGKDHREFVVVRDWIRAALQGCSSQVEVEVPKSVLKQGGLQHLYGRVAARLQPGVDDAQILAALHPTPAVCGRPRDQAMNWLREHEQFDRGYYAGPFGWMSGEGAEFAVAIRSALINTRPTPGSGTQQPASVSGAAPFSRQAQLLATTQHDAYLYAGVGVVTGSIADQEWQELDLKTRQLRLLLQPRPELTKLPNINLAWTYLLVDECCRQGVNMFCVAPGSRSSPLTSAIAAHPRARLNVCVDERSLGFWALGYGRATGTPAAVITSSGTAVANLLPAVIEASQSEVPLLLLTADRPAELRDTGANQTIDQIKIFGGYTRWFQDVAPPADGVPGRTVLTTADTAVRYSCGHVGTPGPVHLNFQFREPLAPIQQPWDTKSFCSGLQGWLANPSQPYTANISVSNSRSSTMVPTDPSSPAAVAMSDVCQLLRSTHRGLIVVGELVDPADSVAVQQLSHQLGWPVAVDVLSGLRGCRCPGLVHHMDHVLLGDKTWWEGLAPSVILQVGPRITSKRVNQFMEWCAGSRGAAWLYLGKTAARHDAAHLISHHITASIQVLTHSMSQYDGIMNTAQQPHNAAAYGHLLQSLSQVVSEEVEARLQVLPALSEPGVARQLSQLLPHGHALFLGNSMPIRDMDMYAAAAGNTLSSTAASRGATNNGSQYSAPLRIAANRGASGIDGVLSTAAGFAQGADRPTTLIVGDLSFLHDTNGLNMLRSGESRPPLTVVLVNNNGGGIFSFLPIKSALPEDQFEPLWATPQNADFEGLCRSHGIPYQKVTDGGDSFQTALKAAWSSNRHSVVEVVTDRRSNLAMHRAIQAHVQRAVQTAYTWLQQPPEMSAQMLTIATDHVNHESGHHNGNGSSKPGHASDLSGKAATADLVITSLQWIRFDLPLTAPLTSNTTSTARSGFMLQMTTTTSSSSVSGVGEVAPLPGLHAEDLTQCEAQLSLLSQLLQGCSVPTKVGLLGGRLSSWFQDTTGMPADQLLPSVRYGLEQALLSCLAKKHAHAQKQVTTEQQDAASCDGQQQQVELIPASLFISPTPRESRQNQQGDVDHVSVNGLISSTDPVQAAAQAVSLVQDKGYSALKIKVARAGSNPEDDAQLVLAVRQAVGPQVVLRADANKGWSLDEALRFGYCMSGSGCKLQYVEEPCRDVQEAATFWEMTGVPYALDESLDSQPPHRRPAYLADQHRASAGGLAAVVLKPSFLGGIETSLHLARTAAALGMQAVISSAFDGPVGMSGLVALAAEVDRVRAGTTPMIPGAASTTASDRAMMAYGAQQAPSGTSDAGAAAAASEQVTHHGLGTFSWFDGHALPQSTACFKQPAVSPQHAASAAGEYLASQHMQSMASPSQQVRGRDSAVKESTWSSPGIDFSVVTVCPAAAAAAAEAGSTPTRSSPHVVFLHGFLGCKEDWLPIMTALASVGVTSTALDLPGHGHTCVPSSGTSVESCADAVAAALQDQELVGCCLVGYSMGGRLALSLAARQPHVLGSLICVSGTPGINDMSSAARRASSDDRLAELLRTSGLEDFLKFWYDQPMWSSLKQHPQFGSMLSRRLTAIQAASGGGGGGVHGLAACLTAFSTGRMTSVWPALRHWSVPSVVMSGSLDDKFKAVGNKMVATAASSSSTAEGTDQVAHSATRVAPGGTSLSCSVMKSVVVEGAGHALPVERPWAIVSAVLDMIRR